MGAPSPGSFLDMDTLSEQKLMEMSLPELISRRSAFQHRAFRLVLEVAVIFGIPALLAFFLGRYIDNAAGTDTKWILVCLAVSFIFSWVIMIIQYRKIDRELKLLDKLIKEKREAANDDD